MATLQIMYRDGAITALTPFVVRKYCLVNSPGIFLLQPFLPDASLFVYH